MALIARIFYLAIVAILVIPSCGNSSAADSTLPGKLSGQEIYASNCSMCHGRYGNAGLSGATDLTTSELTFEEATEFVKNGKGNMQAYGEMLNKNEIEAVVEYAFSLRK